MDKMEIDPLAPTQREKTVAEARKMGISGLGSVDKEKRGICTVSANNLALFSLRFYGNDPRRTAYVGLKLKGSNIS
jgi:hypothetical protein